MNPQSNKKSENDSIPKKSWGKKSRDLPGYVMNNLYEIYNYLDKRTSERLGLMMKIPVFIQDPLVALENPVLGAQEIEVRLEEGFSHGPTSARIAVVDFNADTQTLKAPLEWDEDIGWFQIPSEGQDAFGKWIADAPHITDSMEDSKKKARYKDFVDSTIKNPYYHQLNVWAVVQRILEFYEAPQALGRPIPWGFEGNRLMIVPHAGYGENAFYDKRSKSLQFYYFGGTDSPGFTCLSHDIVAHETGHAILDGIRPLYTSLSSVQTAAFHEHIADLTAILLSLDNRDIRHFISESTQGKLGEADILANLAEEFGRKVSGRPYLRTAFNKLKMSEVEHNTSPHHISQVLTGAMYEILTNIADKHLAKNKPVEGQTTRTVTPDQALWWAADRFRRVALQSLDLCPPCDIQFSDYVKAVIRNDILTNPVDEQGYRRVMLDVFHERQLCTCDYQPGEELPEDCIFQEALEQEGLNFVQHSITSISSSRTAAYYFLNDNRKILRIPKHQDIVVADLYGNSKFGAAATRLPHEVILQYIWQEQVLLENDSDKDLQFRDWNGKKYPLYCGGTLVFDGRNNLLSWFRKPGTEHITPEEEKAIRAKAKPTKLEQGQLADLEEGRRRKEKLKSYLSGLINRNLVGLAAPESRFTDRLKPVVAFEAGDVVRFEITPHLRNSDFDQEGAAWQVNY